MAVTVYGLLRSAQGFADQAKVFQLYAGATLVDEFDDSGVAMMDTQISSPNARAKLKAGISPVFTVPAGTTITEVRISNGEVSNNIMATIAISVPSYVNAGTYTITSLNVNYANV